MHQQGSTVESFLLGKLIKLPGLRQQARIGPRLKRLQQSSQCKNGNPTGQPHRGGRVRAGAHPGAQAGSRCPRGPL